MWTYLSVLHLTCLATVGVCVFRALTSVGALFIFTEVLMRRNYKFILITLLTCMLCFSFVACTDRKSDKEALSLNYTSFTMEVNETVYLKVTSKSNDTVNWQTSNFALASVVNGKVTAKKIGNVTITATQGGATATCTVTILQSSMSLNYSSVDLYVGEYILLRVTSKSTEKITWRTSNLVVASVSSNGWVTARKAGTATITATQGYVKVTCIVIVK